MADTKLKSAVLLLTVVFMLTSININYDLKKTGGVGVWSSAINDLNSELMNSTGTINLRVHAFTESLIVLSKGKLKMRRVYAGEESYLNGFDLYRDLQPGRKPKEIFFDSQQNIFAVLY